MKKCTRDEVYIAIDGERDYQDDLAGVKKWDEEDRVPAKSVGDFLLLLNVYIQRASVDYADNVGDHQPRKVIRKIAAIAVHCLEQNGVIERKDDNTIFE